MSPSTMLLTILISITLYHTHSEVITCKGDCQCNTQIQSSDEECILNCASSDACKASTLTCAPNRPCTIMCTDNAACADYTYVNAISATHVSLICNGNDACKSHLTLICGIGNCALQCGSGTSCDGFGMIDTSRARQFLCQTTNCPLSVKNLQFTPKPTKSPTNPTQTPTISTIYPTKSPTYNPTKTPSISPTKSPTKIPTTSPTYIPTINPTYIPTYIPTYDPTNDPTHIPTYDPTKSPTIYPTKLPTNDPTYIPTYNPTYDPTNDPSNDPTIYPTIYPTQIPTLYPSNNPTITPTYNPSVTPTKYPTIYPTISTINPTMYPTHNPTNISFTDVVVFYDYDANKNSKKEGNNLVIPMVLICLCIVSLVGLKYFCWYRKKKMEKKKDKIQSEENVGIVDDELFEIVQEGPSGAICDGDGDNGYIIRVHYNGKQFDFKLRGSNSGETDDCGWNDNTYDQLVNIIKKKFGIRHNNFGLHEIVDDCPVDIDDMDDIAASFDCCVYDTNRRSIDLYVKTENDLHFGFNNVNVRHFNVNHKNTNTMNGEALLELSDSGDDIVTVGE